ncbi:hypothetical protein [Labrys monachus]|uniref:Outer membrane biogenesis lipoprotein LolB n=1 Tax=Labrys monachus TaxID=217067 RepID=A0ABU0FQW3_9HYPH|nr:hypothetical protein [Labrys monachus]MDQ0396450.1 outer membrane biogenesis lipoprotein LolB [Labrys monachus]
MLRQAPAVLALLLLAACTVQPPVPTVRSLDRNTLACRNRDSVQALHSAGAGFQRQADAELASGRCRMFQKGDRIESGSRDGFVDPASKRQYWIYHWG